MPPLDLEPQLSIRSGDRKVAALDESEDPNIPESDVVEYPPDFPPESFWLSKDAEYDWFDRNAFLDRNESIKGNSNSTNLNPNINSTFLKSKPGIISLPNVQKTNHVDSKRKNCKLAKIWLFPKRLDSIDKEPPVVSMAEPSSPKVSCCGKVRSKKCSRRKGIQAANELEIPATQNEKTDRMKKTCLLSRIKSLFRSDCRRLVV